MPEFRRLLKLRMEERGVTPSQLAKDCGIGRSYLYRVLDGKQIPTADWMEAVGKHVGIKVKLTIR
jgi:predicted transcriptional regulator